MPQANAPINVDQQAIDAVARHHGSETRQVLYRVGNDWHVGVELQHHRLTHRVEVMALQYHPEVRWKSGWGLRESFSGDIRWVSPKQVVSLDPPDPRVTEAVAVLASMKSDGLNGVGNGSSDAGKLAHWANLDYQVSSVAHSAIARWLGERKNVTQVTFDAMGRHHTGIADASPAVA